MIINFTSTVRGVLKKAKSGVSGSSFIVAQHYGGRK
jgi:hypothetical protein